MSRLIFVFLFIFLSSLNGYESEDKLKVIIIGKVANYIKWKEKDNKQFIITVLNYPNENLFNDLLNGKKIKKKDILIKYIDNIDQLSDTDILYIPVSQASKLTNILKNTDGKNILTVSGIRGFAEKGGIVQVYFVSQKVKLKVNLDVAKRESLKISSSLLRIAKIVKGN